MANDLKRDLTDKVVKMARSGAHFRCKGGPGCLPYVEGTRIYGTWLHDDENAIISSYDVQEIISTDIIYEAEG